MVQTGNSLGRVSNSPFPASEAILRPAYAKYLTEEASLRGQMGPLDVFLRVSFAGFAAILATVSVQSYARHRERRFLLLTAAFGIFLVQGLWLLIEMATVAVSSVGSGWLALNLGVLISLYLALLR